MYYYKRNIGDYHKKAGRLSMLEHGAYTLLIDACYDREQFPTLEDAIDWTWARTEAEITAVKFVLSKFFTLEGEVYVQNRIKEEIQAYQQMAETNTRIAKEREEKRKKGKPAVNDSSRTVNEACPISHEPPPNQEPITINQEPETNNQIKSLKAFGDFEKKRLADFGFDSMPSAWLASVKTDWPELHSDDIDVKWVKFLGHYGSKDLELCESDWFASFAKWIASDAPKLIEARKPKTEPVKRRAPPLILGIPLDRIIREKYQWEDDETCARRLKSDDLVSRPKVGAGL